MNAPTLAINKRTALMMFWNAGICGLPQALAEQSLKDASDKLEASWQPTKGYWYADDVAKMIGG